MSETASLENIAYEAAILAVQRYASTHQRPSQVTQKQAAEMLGLTPQTVNKMVKTGRLELNQCGMIPITTVDDMLSVGYRRRV